VKLHGQGLSSSANSCRSFAQSKIHIASQNQSPWNYLRGIQRASKRPASSLKDFASQFASIDAPDDVHSSHALDLLADIYAEEENDKEKAGQALDLLAKKYDPIRINFWNYRKSLLGLESDAISAPTVA